MSLLKSVGSGYEPSIGGAEKARGLENAALRHAAKLERLSTTARPATTPSTTAQSAAVVTLGAIDSGSGNYTRPGAIVGVGASATVLGGDASLHAHQHLGARAAPIVVAPANEPSTAFTLGEGSKLHINQRGTSGGSGSLIVGDNANVHINQRGTSGSSGSLIVGDNANLRINDRPSGKTAHVLAADATTLTANALAARTAPANANALTEDAVISSSLVVNVQTNEVHSRVQFNQQERYKQIIEGLGDAERIQKLTVHANNGRHLARAQSSYLDPKLQMLKLLVEKTLEPADNSQVDAERPRDFSSAGSASAESSITEGLSSSAEA